MDTFKKRVHVHASSIAYEERATYYDPAEDKATTVWRLFVHGIRLLLTSTRYAVVDCIVNMLQVKLHE